MLIDPQCRFMNPRGKRWAMHSPVPSPCTRAWPCAHESLAVVTNPRIFKKPTPMDLAMDAAKRLLENLSVGFRAVGDGYVEALERVVRSANLQAANVHDARIAALCLFHGVRVMWSADRDFSRFPALLKFTNPLPAK